MESGWELVFPMIATLAFFILIGWIVNVVAKTKRERTTQLAEVQSRMLEKFASSHEFVNFLQTRDGQQYLKTFTTVPRPNPRQKILKSVQTGVVLIVFAIGLIWISFLIPSDAPHEEPPFVFGFLGFFLGAGFLASAAVSYYMSRAWGLFSAESDQVTKES